MKKFFTSPILWAIIGISLTVFGFMLSDKDKYPVGSKFSAWLIIAGVAITSIAGVAQFGNPLKAISVNS